MPPVFGLIARLGEVAPAEMWEVFNMGCGFCVIVAEDDAPAAVELLSAYHPGAAVIGRVTDAAGRVTLPTVGLQGDTSGLQAAA